MQQTCFDPLHLSQCKIFNEIDDPIFVPWIDNPQILRRFSRKFQLVVSTNCFLSLSFSVASLERNELTKLTRVRTSLKLVRGMEKKEEKEKRRKEKKKKSLYRHSFDFTRHRRTTFRSELAANQAGNLYIEEAVPVARVRRRERRGGSRTFHCKNRDRSKEREEGGPKTRREEEERF